MGKALVILAIAAYGFYLTELWHPAYAPSDNPDISFPRMIGWVMIGVAVWNWRAILGGVQATGKLLVFALLVGALAAFFGGQTGLWESFF